MASGSNEKGKNMLKRSYLVGILVVMVSVFGKLVIADANLQDVQASPTARQSPDPKALLQAAAEACLKLKTIEYVFEHETIPGNGPGFTVPRITATVRQERADVPRAAVAGKYHATGSITLPAGMPDAFREMHGMKPGQTTAEFAFAYDGKAFQILSPEDQTLLIAQTPTAKTVITLRDNVGVAVVGNSDYTGPEPLKRFMENHGNFKYAGTAEVAGVKCHAISATRTVTTATRTVTIETMLYLGVDDLLPRRQVSGSLQSTMRILKINQPFAADAFTLKAPNGYSARLITEAESKLRSRGLLQPGSPAPDWKLRDVAGREHALGEYRGKVVVLDFWATWCGPCIKAMPSLQALHEKFRQQEVVVIGISTREGEDAKPLEFMKSKGLTYQLLLNGETISEAYHAEALPTLYVVGKDGRIIHSERGYSETGPAELEQVLTTYLKTGAFKQVFERK